MDLGVSAVSKALSLRRFFQVKSAFYLADYTTLANNNDKMAKKVSVRFTESCFHTILVFQ